jgi:hypothetical protein
MLYKFRLIFVQAEDTDYGQVYCLNTGNRVTASRSFHDDSPLFELEMLQFSLTPEW